MSVLRDDRVYGRWESNIERQWKSALIEEFIINKKHSRSIAVANREEVCDLLTKVAGERKEEVTNSINFNRRWIIKQNNEILKGSTLHPP